MQQGTGRSIRGPIAGMHVQLLAGRLWPGRQGLWREVHAGRVLVRLQRGVVWGAGRVCRVGGPVPVRLQPGGLPCGRPAVGRLFVRLLRCQLWPYV